MPGRRRRTARSSTATRSWRILALALRERGALADDTVVATVMSNLGFAAGDGARGHHRRRRPRSATATCSRRCAAGGYSLGGEQSGHVIMSDHATTGDGILTALHVLARMAADRPAAGRAGRGHDPAAAGAGQRPGVDKARADADPSSPRPVAAAEAELGDTGRVLLRPSGTEPLVRVMVEAADARGRRRPSPTAWPTSSSRASPSDSP